MTFKPRPYDPYREDRRTPAQKAAHNRNWLIFKLRGLHAQVCLLTGWRKRLAWWLVDRELARIGADPETKRQIDRRKQWEREL